MSPSCTAASVSGLSRKHHPVWEQGTRAGPRQRTACGWRMGGAWGSGEDSKQQPQKEQSPSCRRRGWDPAEPRRTGSSQGVRVARTSRPRLAGGGVLEILTGPQLPPGAGPPAWLSL